MVPGAAQECQSSTHRIVSVAPVVLPRESSVRRIPSRLIEFRSGDFETKFDFDTLIYDAVPDREGRRVRLLCPSLLNLRDGIEKGRIEAVPSHRACAFAITPFDRHDQIVVDVPDGTQALHLFCEFGTFDIDLSPDEAGFFADERVVFTLSKNNELVWIQDWARFYRDAHGATAILIYDNGSKIYSPERLRDALADVGGIGKVMIVHWPFRHGPPGHGKKQYWDSNFSQLGAFEDARWRFLRYARSILNCDIDELVLSPRQASVFDAVERSISGIIAFRGDWVFGIEGTTRVPDEDDPIRFTDYRHSLARISERRFGIVPTYPMECKPKWAAVPAKCPVGAQWHIHNVNGWLPSRFPSRRFRFRHFREISTSWKYDRSARETFEVKRHIEDRVMEAAFERVDWKR